MDTCEMLKAIEGTNKTFIDQFGNRIGFDDNDYLLWDTGQVFMITRGILENSEWEEVKEPVTWEEAFKAGLEGKKIKPEGQHTTYAGYEELHYALMYLGERPGYFKEIMLDNWYIED